MDGCRGMVEVPGGRREPGQRDLIGPCRLISPAAVISLARQPLLLRNRARNRVWSDLTCFLDLYWSLSRLIRLQERCLRLTNSFDLGQRSMLFFRKKAFHVFRELCTPDSGFRRAGVCP